MALGVEARPLAHAISAELETGLTPGEKRRIALRLSGALGAGGLLGVGLLHRWLVPGQEDVSSLVLGVGAMIAVLPVVRAGFIGFWRRDPDATVDQLVGVALLAAVATGDFETAILVPLVLVLGHSLEERSILGARAAIEGLKTLRPVTASRIGPAGEEAVPVERLALGDRLVVRPGEAFPADGQILRGRSTVDQSTLTGESAPEAVAPGGRVFAGTVNLSGVLEMEVTDLAEATALGRVVELLREAERSKAPIVRVIERYAAYYLPTVLLVAGLVLVATQDLPRAIAVLVVSCPCALVLASPSAMTAALAVAARLGILVKNTRFLEVLGDVETVVLDKTGTATAGQLEVVDVRPLGGTTPDEVLTAAARCAGGSRHPVARAILARSPVAAEAGETDSIEEVSGRGVEVRANGLTVRLGSARWLRELGLALPEEPVHAGPVVWVARERRPLGCVLLADCPRPGARRAVDELRRLGVDRVVLLTGDRPDVAAAVARELEVDEVRADCLPAAKVEVVEQERATGRRVMVVGDGVNDAPALGCADVGVAMGAMGSDVAVTSADIALMGSDLARLPDMIRLARRTRAVINQNVLFAIGSGLAVMVPAGLGLVGPVVGALLQNLGALVVIVNSARLLRWDQTVRA